MELVDRVMALGTAIRYAALAHGAEIITRLRPDLKPGDGTTSSGESDRYEELLVNPAVLLLTQRRGEIDCGGLDHVVISYGNFHQLVIPVEDGHLSVAVERTADPQSLVAPIRRLLNNRASVDTAKHRRFG